MSKYFRHLAMLIYISFSFYSCSKKSETTVTPALKDNTFSYNNSTLTFANGYLNSYGTILRIKKNVFDLYLTSSNVTFKHGSATAVDTISGNGNLMIVTLFTNSNTLIDLGTYKYDTVEAHIDNVFFGSEIYVDYNFETGKGTNEVITEGAFIVNKNTPSYDIDFNLKTASGKAFKGKYVGALSYFSFAIPAARNSNYVYSQKYILRNRLKTLLNK